MIRSASGALAKPPPFSAVFCSHRRVDDEELAARRVVDAAAVERRLVVLDRQAVERDAHAAVLDAAAVGAGLVVAHDAVAISTVPKLSMLMPPPSSVAVLSSNVDP